ncbi:MAG TPA: ribosomal L7Ae/L30e/S12e/Gadd45 family protein [Bacilli bacterium]|nr:ribosomal L7Ae/L30e/S12e/Gadd45 family protein [Bacilli bacterium]
MVLHRIRETEWLVGINQTAKALKQHIVQELFVAKDADEQLVSRIALLAQQHQMPITWVETMKQLGNACGIEVGAATAAIVKH